MTLKCDNLREIGDLEYVQYDNHCVRFRNVTLSNCEEDSRLLNVKAAMNRVSENA